MNCCTEYKNNLRSTLDLQDLGYKNISSPRSRDNTLIFYEELTSRAFLWVDQLVNTIFSLSCKEVRHLAADTFEYIGVIVCTALQCLISCLIYCDIAPSMGLVHAQQWVESTAAKIAGDEEQIQSIQNLRTNIEEQLEELRYLQAALSTPGHEYDSLLTECEKTCEILRNSDPTKLRRLNQTTEWLDTTASNLRKTLKKLQALLTPNKPAITTSQLQRIRNLGHEPQNPNGSFRELSTELQIIIDLLHQQDDPEG